MESILAKLVQPDSAVIAEGTKELKAAFKSPESIPELCKVMTGSPEVQIRQYAALLLRKKFAKGKKWSEMAPAIRDTIKQGCLKVSRPPRPK